MRSGFARGRKAAAVDHASEAVGASVTIRLSEEAMASTGGPAGKGVMGGCGLALAILESLAAFRQDAETLFALLGFDRAAAERAGQAATEAIRAEIAAPAFGAEIDRFLRMKQPEECEGRSRRASLTVQEATVAWDADADRYVAGAGRGALFAQTQSKGGLPRRSPPETHARGKRAPPIRYDAVIPLYDDGGRNRVERAGD